MRKDNLPTSVHGEVVLILVTWVIAMHWWALLELGNCWEWNVGLLRSHTRTTRWWRATHTTTHRTDTLPHGLDNPVGDHDYTADRPSVVLTLEVSIIRSPGGPAHICNNKSIAGATTLRGCIFMSSRGWVWRGEEECDTTQTHCQSPTFFLLSSSSPSSSFSSSLSSSSSSCSSPSSSSCVTQTQCHSQTFLCRTPRLVAGHWVFFAF